MNYNDREDPLPQVVWCYECGKNVWTLGNTAICDECLSHKTDRQVVAELRAMVP
jgi:Zn finger protein HypA/HybF involved in hydrogenase expression